MASERGTTQTIVKVPKYWLSVKGIKASVVKDSEEVGLEAATLQKVRTAVATATLATQLTRQGNRP